MSVLAVKTGLPPITDSDHFPIKLLPSKTNTSKNIIIKERITNILSLDLGIFTEDIGIIHAYRQATGWDQQNTVPLFFFSTISQYADFFMKKI